MGERSITDDRPIAFHCCIPYHKKWFLLIQSPPPPELPATDALSDLAREVVRVSNLAREALRVSESRYRRLFETAQDGILLINSDTAQIEDVNPYLIDMLGYTHTEFLGKKLWEVGSFADRAESKEMFAELQSKGYVRYENLPLKTKAGTEIDVEFVSNSYDCEGVKVIQCNIRNITERTVADAKLLRQTQLYAALSQCNKAIVHCENVAELFPLVCRAAVEFGGMQMAWIGWAEPASQRVTCITSLGAGAEYLHDIQISMDTASLYGNGPTSTAIRENRPVWCQDFQNDPATVPWRERGTKFGWRASASLPLHRKGIPVGALTLYANEAGAFDEAAQNLLLEIASDVSFALDNFDIRAERLRATDSLRKLSLAVEQSPASVIIADLDANIEYVNEAFTRITGYGRDETIGKNPRILQSGKTPKQTHVDMWATLTRGEVWKGEVINKRKNGSEYTEFAIISPVRQPDGTISHYLAIKEDITEEKLMEASLRASEERYRALVEQSIAGTYIVQDGRFAYVNPRFAEIFSYDSAEELIGMDVLSLIAEKDRERVKETMRLRLEDGKPTLNYTFTAMRKDGVMIEVGVHGSRAEYEGRLAIIGLIQDITEKQRAEEQIQHYVAQLEGAFMRTVEVATTLSEMRDPYTAGHERRVGELAVAIGGELGFDERRVEGLRVSGYLHDIGKITIPAEILAKPGRLSPVENLLIQSHPQAGYDVLKNIEFPWPVAQVALQHHERLDGSGYPNGLKGDEILLEARILAVADVVEAMSSHRPYRPGLGIRKALAEIKRGSGTVYDPTVAEACLRLFREKGYVLSS